MAIKLTESRLRQIIREEARRISEISAAAGYKKRVGKGAMAPGGYDDPMDYAPWATGPKDEWVDLAVGQVRAWGDEKFKILSIDEENDRVKIRCNGRVETTNIDMAMDSTLVG